ncbi:MAG TPA: ABC transporter permease [Gemmatimonadaceae bacterium]|jgi:predicted permease
MRALISRARAMVRHLLRRATLEREMDEEFNSHLQHRADDLERRGLSRDAAERAARVEFGGVEAQKEVARDARGLRLWEDLRANVAFAARGLGHHPIQSLIVVTTLTLGIGISAVVFSVMNALAFRARVDRDAATFTRILVSYRTDTTAPSFPGPAPLSDFLAYARNLRSLSSITGWQHVQLALSDGARPTPGALVTCGFFDVYGPVRPIAGRMLQRDDCESRAPVVVIGNELWRSTFGGDTAAVGRVLRINGQTVRVVGVAPVFSSASTDDELWLPYTLRESLHLGPNDAASPQVIPLFIDGRLAPGAARSDVSAEARVIAAQQDQLTAGRHSAVFVSDGSLITKPGNGVVVSGILAVVFVGLACLALVACASVVSILLAIAHGRRTEMALRMALGAGAPRLAAMLGTESLVLACVAGAAASALTFRLPRILLEWIIQRSVNFSLTPDWHVFAFLLVTTISAALVAANAPIRFVLALDLNSTLRRVPDHSGGGVRRGNLLMSAEIGGAAALLVATIALTRLPTRIANSPPRFDASHVLAMNLRAPQPATGGWRSFHDDVERTLMTVTGVRGIAFATAQPVGDEGTGVTEVKTASGPRRAMPSIEVSPSYFDVFGIRVERGRSFTLADADCAAAVCPAIVSREAARELWGSADPLGQHLTLDATHTLAVIGIASDASSEVAEPVQASMMYTPWRPNTRLYQPFVKVEDAGSGVVRRTTSLVSERFAGAVAAPRTVEEEMRLVTDAFQRIGEVVGLVAAITAILAIVGVYGVVALAARRRLKEMGIRLALGARPMDVYRAMVAPNVRPLATGLVLGALFATVLAVESDRLVAAVFPARLVDPAAFLFAALGLAAAVTIAMLLPARRATVVDPALVLRQD